jgi:hypothetical protein
VARLWRLFDLLFRWFVELSVDERVFDASTFSKNRDRLLTTSDQRKALLELAEALGSRKAALHRDECDDLRYRHRLCCLLLDEKHRRPELVLRRSIFRLRPPL